MNEWEKMTLENTKQIEKLIVTQQQCSKDLSTMIALMEDQEIKSVKRRLTSLEKKMELINPVLVMCRYPKVTLVLFMIISSLYISDIRHPILKFLGLI